MREHLIHISAWEHWLLALLNGQDRTAAMGVDPATDDVDKLNDLIIEAHRDKTLEQVQAHFQQSHAQPNLERLFPSFNPSHQGNRGTLSNV